MNSHEAKLILGLFRPGSGEENDPQVAEALEQARRDPELSRWFEQTCAFHAAIQRKLREIPVPPDLPEAILAGRNSARNLLVTSSDEQGQTLAGNKILLRAWWQHPGWLAAAASILVLLGLAVFWLQPRANDRFADYRLRMVRTAVRQYRMDIATNDLKEVRQFLRRRGAPADFAVTNGLEKLSITGGVCARWRNHPVSMVCFDRGDRQMVFLFVVDREALKDPPRDSTKMAKVNKLLTCGWTQGGRTYLLAGPGDSVVPRYAEHEGQ